MKQIKVCLIGTGRMGQIRAHALYSNPKFILVGIVGHNISLADKYSVPLFSELSDFFSSEFGKETKAFVISNSTQIHASTIEKLLTFSGENTKIFIEKPVSPTPEEIKTSFSLVKKHSSKLCCSFQRRFDNSYISVFNALKEGKIGKVLFVRVFFADHPTPELKFLLKDGCPFMDLTPHDIDYVLWCLKNIDEEDRVISVQATGMNSNETLKENDILDNVTLNMKMKSGCLINMFFSRGCSYGYDQRVEFFGTKGKIEVSNQTKTSVIESSEKGIFSDVLKYSFPERFKQAFEDEIDQFGKVCLDEIEWKITEEDCCLTQEIAMKAKETGFILFTSFPFNFAVCQFNAISVSKADLVSLLLEEELLLDNIFLLILLRKTKNNI
eukprot:snap_masked-scaffold_89-processed-gene-0.34-mRNA-1 protein AED:1.00 eAED:1.00 QI:0/0/0/0/1/1/4/0/382